MISKSGRLIFTVSLSLVVAGAQAQSSVSIYGVADAGMAWINNVGGSSRIKVDSGQSAASRLGFRGSEDLGSVLSAVFNLEMGLNIDTGATQSATKLLNRGSFVGFSSSQWETVTLGRPVDFLNSDLPPDSVPILQGGMAAGWQSAAGQQLATMAPRFLTTPSNGNTRSGRSSLA
jgi:predicted porin